MVQIHDYSWSLLLGSLYCFPCGGWCCGSIRGLAPMNVRHKLANIAILILLLVLGTIYFIFDPSSSVFFPKCPVMMLTGYPCAGCGSQRAIHALLHFDFRTAVEHNALVVVFIPLLLLMFFASCFRERFPKLYIFTHHKYVAYAFLMVILLWWVIRIVLGLY